MQNKLSCGVIHIIVWAKVNKSFSTYNAVWSYNHVYWASEKALLCHNPVGLQESFGPLNKRDNWHWWETWKDSYVIRKNMHTDRLYLVTDLVIYIVVIVTTVSICTGLCCHAYNLGRQRYVWFPHFWILGHRSWTSNSNRSDYWKVTEKLHQTQICINVICSKQKVNIDSF